MRWTTTTCARLPWSKLSHYLKTFNFTQTATNMAKVSSVQIANDNSTIAVTMNEPVYRTTGGSGAREGRFCASISGGNATLASATPTSISISGNVYTLGMNLSGQAPDLRRSPLCQRLEVVFTMRPTTPHRRAMVTAPCDDRKPCYYADNYRLSIPRSR